MQALISPNQISSYISSWEKGRPIFTIVGARIAEVAETPFEVGQPLFWVECSPDVVADQWAYDMQTAVISKIPPSVEPPQPVTTGTQTF